ncbi:hypothetical protein ACIOWA_23300, partial [Pseudomonas sp. NPDC087614]
MFGKLSWEAVPFHEPIVMVTIAMIALGGLALFAAITYFKKWTYLWTEWLTSVDHKKIGVMYIVVAMVMLLRGFADAIMMRTQLAMATGGWGTGRARCRKHRQHRAARSRVVGRCVWGGGRRPTAPP